MNVGSFIKLASQSTGKITPTTLIANNLQFLQSIEVLQPVLSMYQRGSLLPTPALQQILLLLATLPLVTDEKSKDQKKKQPKKTPRYQIFLYIQESENFFVPLSQTWEAEDYGAAERLADRKLFQREDAACAEVIGDGIATRIYRHEAVGRLFPRSKGPVCQGSKRSTPTVSWVGKAKQTRVVLPRN